MRGKALHILLHRRTLRITPAHAGKRRSGRNAVDASKDHPRTCGEKCRRPDIQAPVLGSPPHMRGKVSLIGVTDIAPGITPAHAGKRRTYKGKKIVQKDHPRTCGEKVNLLHPLLFLLGSPPHMRGKGYIMDTDANENGITPAHAGKRLKRSRSIVPHAAIVPLFPSVCNKPAGSDGSPAGHDAPPFLPIENAAPASPAYNLRSL